MAGDDEAATKPGQEISTLVNKKKRVRLLLPSEVDGGDEHAPPSR
jgi:hypothetical protein